MKKSYPKLHSLKWKNGRLAPNVHVVHPQYPLNCDDILKGAWEEGLKEVVVFGYNQDGKEYVASNVGYQDTAYMFSRGHQFMLRQEDD